MNPAFKQVKQSGRAANLLQGNTSDALKQIALCPLVSGVMVSGATVNGTFQLPHGLGRSYLGWLLSYRDSNVQIWDAPRGPGDQNNIYLQANGTASISIWVF